MRPLSRRAHGFLDYLVGVVLIVSPRLLGLEPGSAEAAVPVFLGWTAIAYSLFTQYELGLVRLLPFRAHLTLDTLHGIVLATSPWVFGFSERVWAPHVVLGVIELAVVALTRVTSPSGSRLGTPAH